VEAADIFIWEVTAQGVWETKVRQWAPREAPVGGPQNLKQFADTVYRFGLHTRLQFKNFAELTPRFLTYLFLWWPFCGGGLLREA